MLCPGSGLCDSFRAVADRAFASALSWVDAQSCARKAVVRKELRLLPRTGFERLRQRPAVSASGLCAFAPWRCVLSGRRPLRQPGASLVIRGHEPGTRCIAGRCGAHHFLCSATATAARNPLVPHTEAICSSCLQAELVRIAPIGGAWRRGLPLMAAPCREELTSPPWRPRLRVRPRWRRPPRCRPGCGRRGLRARVRLRSSHHRCGWGSGAASL